MTNEVTDRLLTELLAWTRFANRRAFIETVQDTLSDERDLRAYEATDGIQSQGEVAFFAGLSQPTVSRLWARWKRLGLVVDGEHGRPRHLIRPSDIGIAIPER